MSGPNYPNRTEANLPRLLLVEDDEAIAKGLIASLEKNGIQAMRIANGVRANEILSNQEFDAVILDLTLPGMDGSEVLRRLRERGCRTPVLVLSARNTVQDRVIGLDLGADDYIVKPFNLLELEARIRALLRRASIPVPENSADNLELTVNRATRIAAAAGRSVELSAREAALLEVFLEKRNQVLSREELLAQLGSDGGKITENAVEVYVHRLRKKLNELQIDLRTVRGLGYMLNLQSNV